MFALHLVALLLAVALLTATLRLDTLLPGDRLDRSIPAGDGQLCSGRALAPDPRAPAPELAKVSK